MNKNVLALLKEMSLKELVLVTKLLMKNMNINHVTGFADISYLNEKFDDKKIELLINDVIKHNVLIFDKGTLKVEDMIFTFVNSWIHSERIAIIKKPSFAESKCISITKVNNLFLCTVQDTKCDKAVLIVDNNFDNIFNYINLNENKKDILAGYDFNKIQEEINRHNENNVLTINPSIQVDLQCVNNVDGKKFNVTHLYNINNEQYDRIEFDEKANSYSVVNKNLSELSNDIKTYIETYCYHITKGDKREKPNSTVEKDSNNSVPDKEPYTNLSFAKMINSEKFPKGIFALAKSYFSNLFKNYLSPKKVLKSLLFAMILPILTFMWNVYGMCFKNDTFNIGAKAFLGNATAFLFAGTIINNQVRYKSIGIPDFIHFKNTLWLTIPLYFLIAILVLTIFRDIIKGKIGKNVKSFFHLKSNISNYATYTSKSISYYINVGIIIACIINLLLFNPFSVFILAILLFFSFTKAENGAVAPLTMLFSSSLNYKRALNKKCECPLFANHQLRLFGISIGLFLLTIINAILWKFLNFNFWVRLILSIVLIVYALIKLGIVKISSIKNPKVSSLLVFIINAIILIISISVVIYADDGGITESGGTIVGLLKNSGWPTIAMFSGVLGIAAGAAAIAFLAAPIGGAILAGMTVAATTSLITFSAGEKGKEVAADFLFGDYSPYGGNNIIAKGLNTAVGCVPYVGKVWGGISAVRDGIYDYQNGDYTALCMDVVNGFLNVKGLANTKSISTTLSDAAKDAIEGQFMSDARSMAKDNHMMDNISNLVNSAKSN